MSETTLTELLEEQSPLDTKTVVGIFGQMLSGLEAIHDAGLEVLLDVVYNHTAEGNEEGPTFCFRGLANRAYYILEDGGDSYANYSGTGNTLNANHSIIRRMIVDSLHYWVEEMHVDGFRFDLPGMAGRPLLLVTDVQVALTMPQAAGRRARLIL